MSLSGSQHSALSTVLRPKLPTTALFLHAGVFCNVAVQDARYHALMRQLSLHFACEV